MARVKHTASKAPTKGPHKHKKVTYAKVAKKAVKKPRGPKVKAYVEVNEATGEQKIVRRYSARTRAKRAMRAATREMIKGHFDHFLPVGHVTKVVKFTNGVLRGEIPAKTNFARSLIKEKGRPGADITVVHKEKGTCYTVCDHAVSNPGAPDEIVYPCNGICQPVQITRSARDRLREIALIFQVQFASKAMQKAAEADRTTVTPVDISRVAKEYIGHDRRLMKELRIEMNDKQAKKLVGQTLYGKPKPVIADDDSVIGKADEDERMVEVE